MTNESDLTAGEVATFLESKGGEPVNVQGFLMRWGATVAVDPDTGDWKVIAEADWVIRA